MTVSNNPVAARDVVSLDLDVALKKDPDLWFADGNVVIVAQSHLVFRVHEGVLSRHSTVFNTILSFGSACPIQSNAVSETVAMARAMAEVSTTGAEMSVGEEWMDGCRVVRVTDRAYDFKHLLHMLYDGHKHIATSKDEPIDFCVLAAVIRVAHKYDMSGVAAGPTALLSSCFDRDETVAMVDAQKPVHVSDDEVRIEPHRDAIEAFNLFRLIKDEDALSKALYLCCQLGPQVLMKGLPRRHDASVQETLSPSDMLLCWEMQNSLTYTGGQIREDLWKLAVSAERPCKCTQPSCAKLLLAGVFNHQRAPKHTHVLPGRIVADLKLGTLCSAAITKVEALQKASEKDVWEAIEESVFRQSAY